MSFSSSSFLFAFLPALLAVFFLTPRRWRNALLLVFGLVFYAWAGPVYLGVLLFSAALAYGHGLRIGRCRARGDSKGARRALISALTLHLALLLFFKYWDGLAHALGGAGLGALPALGLVMPLGLSFYTFQAISYAVDLYRGTYEPVKNPLRFLLCVTFFPIVASGPITRIGALNVALRPDRDRGRVGEGAHLFVIGLSKKLLLANRIAPLWQTFHTLPAAELTTVGAWLGLLAFALQLYFDFSGYSDMAMGLGRMLGVELPVNFRYPYTARSLSEFWRRWHMTLGAWFRDYLYLPLGGSRVGRVRLVLNLFAVWALTGIWHGAGANFLLWGLYYAALLTGEKLLWGKGLARLPAAVGNLYTAGLAVLGWAFFAIGDAARLADYLPALFGLAGGGAADAATLYHLRVFLPTLLVAMLGATPLPARLWARLPRRAAGTLLPAALLLGLVLCTAYLLSAGYQPFLYVQF